MTVALIVVFYLFVFAIAAGLVVAGVAIMAAADNHSAGVVVCSVLVVLAGVVLWLMLPRRDRFEPPGSKITDESQPALFAEIRAIAEATGQEMPEEIYFALDVNAFVALRGGILGIGGRRVMGIGIPLLRTLRVDELRAVIAHEMGHFHAGDTKLGPWVHSLRMTLARTVINMGRLSDWGLIGLVAFIARAPFLWFRKLFLRVSQAVSRRQELAADALAVRIQGATASIDGLTKTHAAAVAHDFYVHSELMPLLEMGRLPPVGEGFAKLLASKRVAELREEVVSASTDIARFMDPYDSHPPLYYRIANMRDHAPSTAIAADPRPAIELVPDADRIEAREIQRRSTLALIPMKWTEAPELWAIGWHNNVISSRAALGGIQIGWIPLEPRWHIAPRAFRSPMDAAKWWISAVGSAIALILLEEGYSVRSDVGEPMLFAKGDVEIDLFDEVFGLVVGRVNPHAWRVAWTKLGLADRALVR